MVRVVKERVAGVAFLCGMICAAAIIRAIVILWEFSL